MTQIEKNALSAKEEEIRQMKTRLDVSEQLFTLHFKNFSDSSGQPSPHQNDKIKLLLQERKMLENRLEETHLHLYDIKSSWALQNSTLENQLHRVSRQVAEETSEKRKAFEVKESLIEKIKHLEVELIQRDNKVKTLIIFDYLILSTVFTDKVDERRN